MVTQNRLRQWRFGTAPTAKSQTLRGCGGGIDFFFRELIEKVERTKGALKMACYSTNMYKLY